MHSHPAVDKKISILIPAFNASPYLLDLINEIKKTVPTYKILVVNDGSTDNTERLVHQSVAHIISHGMNRGKGAALLTGFSALKNSRWIICLDADGQHSPSDLHAFIDMIETDQYDLIIGFRQRAKTNMPLHRRISNSLTSLLLKLRLAVDVKDAQCGFRAIRVAAIPNYPWTDLRYMFETEFLIQSALNKKKIGWIPVKTIYNNSNSHIKPLADTAKFVTLYFQSFNQ